MTEEIALKAGAIEALLSGYRYRELQVGDIVKLKSGGPNMVVNQIVKFDNKTVVNAFYADEDGCVDQVMGIDTRALLVYA